MEDLALARNMDSSSVVIEEKEYTGMDVGRSGDMTVEASECFCFLSEIESKVIC